MKYAIAFFLFATALTYLAFEHGGFGWLLLWPAASFFIVATGYAALGPRVMGKNHRGEIARWSHLLLFPYRLFVLASWWTAKTLSPEPVSAEIAPGLWIGRRAGESELPPGVALIVDLTSEFAEPLAVRRRCSYLCIPTLDASSPVNGDVRAMIERIATCEGPVYIHCAQGHGRSGALAAVVLIRKGLARDVDDAVRMLQDRRAGVRLNRRQRQFVIRSAVDR